MKILVLIGTVLVVRISCTKQTDPSCQTPDQKQGQCVVIRDCPQFENLGDIKRNKTAIKIVKEYRCGREGNDPKVCCESPEEEDLTVFLDGLETELEYFNSRYLPSRKVCGLVGGEDQIKFGNETRLGEMPWLVALLFRNRSSKAYLGAQCGGSLIAERYVLTAAHCVTNTEREPFRALVGEWRLSTNPDCDSENKCAPRVQNITIEKIFKHPLYRKQLNDIALLRLATTVEYHRFVQPICLPPANMPASGKKDKLLVAGWGATENAHDSDIALKAEITPIGERLCLNLLSFSKRISSTQLCAGHAQSDACSGDSGGPLIRSYYDSYTNNWFAEGIVSYGSSCSQASSISVYTKVSAFSKWIISTIGNYETLKKGSLCTTSDHGSGICVVINECPRLNSVFTESQTSRLQLVTKSLCGFYKVPLVCCPTSDYTPALPYQEYFKVPTETNVASKLNVEVTLEEFIEDGVPDRATCGPVKYSSQIKYGNQTEIGQFPWLAVLLYRSTENQDYLGPKCTGSLISGRYVLTTASCLSDKTLDLFQVILGEWKLTENPDCYSGSSCALSVQNVTVARTIPHPSFNGSSEHDIGLIELKNNVTFTDFVRPICLPPSNLPPLRNDGPLVISGWETTGDVSTNDVAIIARVRPLRQEDCGKVFLSAPDSCVFGPNGTCGIYKGAPLMRSYRDQQGLNWFIEGLGADCHLRDIDAAAIYTRVSSFVEWILNEIVDKNSVDNNDDS